MLLYMLKEYHDIDASDALTFFTERVAEMKGLPPNITSKSKRSNFKAGLDGRTAQTRAGYSASYVDDGTVKFYVLRGFYPDSNIPFKVVASYSTNKSIKFNPHSTEPIPEGMVLHAKVMIGMRPHWTAFNSRTIDKYKECVSESILLDQPVQESDKIDYKYRNFKCMRPKGMPLYREKNYKEKQLKLARASAKKRKAKI